MYIVCLRCVPNFFRLCHRDGICVSCVEDVFEVSMVSLNTGSPHSIADILGTAENDLIS